MSVILIPYVKTTFETPEVLNWLQGDDGIEIPAGMPEGRYPTPRELRQILDSFAELDVKYHVGGKAWYADIWRKDESVLMAMPVPRNEDVPFDYVSLDGSYELENDIIQKISNMCGTFLFLLDGEGPEFVVPGGSFGS